MNGPRIDGCRRRRSAGIRPTAVLVASCAVLMSVVLRPYPAYAANCEQDQTGLVPLIDLAGGSYTADGVTVSGGLYPDGTNVPPAEYAERSVEAGEAVEPLDAAGLPDANGSMGFVGIGGSVLGYEFDGFIARVAGTIDPQVVLVNAGIGGRDLDDWEDPAGDTWARADTLVVDGGLTNAQVVTVWMKNVLSTPRERSFGDWVADNDASTRVVIDNIAQRFPNLKQIFLSSRSYGNYMVNDGKTVEPWAYEHGYAVKSVVADVVAGSQPSWPWVGWGPYLWADGVNPRSDGFNWLCADVNESGSHPSPQGEAKIASLLDTHFSTSPYSPWFRGSASTLAVTGVSPAALERGADQAITVEGRQFAPGATLTLGDGLTVALGTVTQTTIGATVSVAPDAPTGARDVVVTNGGVSARCIGCLSVTAGPALGIDSVAPPVVPLGAIRASVVVSGWGFVEGATVSVSRRVRVISVHFVSPSELAVEVTVAASARPGNRTVTVMLPTGDTASCDCLLVS